ncbi:MAG: pyridoxamine 5'-phosphate oxidase family protein [Holophagaceae bacterium]|nr:pyridoxamine 5'-phosphate oxidase family protein [Holophagaceae bacterium]
MDPALTTTLHDLLEGQRVAALGTLHDGEPFVSLVPFALLPRGGGFVLLVSGLAAHTGDMARHPGVSLMVLGAEMPEVPAQARPRVTVQGRAEFLPAGHPGHSAAGAAYLSKFPQADALFDLADFRLVRIQPLSLRLVAGFGKAATLGPEALVGLGEP